MKTIVKILLFGSLLMSGNFVVAQQDAAPSQNATPKWVSDNGFWVIESNIQTPKNAIVRFYTNNGKLVYSEQVVGVKVNVKKRKTRMELKKVLDNVVLAWEKNGVVKEQGELIAVLGNKK